MMRQREKSASRNQQVNDQAGFTLIEMLIVVAIACLVAPLSFLAFSRLSDTQKMRDFSEEIRETLSEAQMEAIAGSTPITIIFDTNRDCYYVSKHNTRIKESPIDPRMTISSNVYKTSISINRLGSFSQSGTYTFSVGSIRYQLVLLLGQGRYYIDKVDW
ncbi:prepilin-type N-terminal cleavage/methylation domain-containing protein [Sporolactobacillus sp. THM7-4]|nr:prepilin-type N-terminal cleavage/methylation domain-containing protein [Sporolactobacillus sp. THM7-4]